MNIMSSLRNLVFLVGISALVITQSAAFAGQSLSAPTAVIAQGLNDTTIELNWMAIPGADGYAIYRDGKLLTTQPGTLYDDLSLSPATMYSYQIAAIVNGSESPLSTATAAATQAARDTTPPTQPGAIAVSNLTSSDVTLTWPKSVDNVHVMGYRILRGMPGASLSDLVQIKTTEEKNTAILSNLKAGTGYQFAVFAIDADNNHSAVRTVTLTTPPSSDTVAPASPSSSSVTARVFSSSRIDLVWGASTSTDVSAYQIFRDGALVGTVDLPLRRYFSDNGLAPASTHSYQVRSIDSAGNISSLTSARTAATTASGVVKIVRGPYLQWTTSTSARIAWWTNLPATSVVNYGVGNVSNQVSDPVLSVRHVMLIGDLSSGTTYTYQVTSANTSSAVLTFNTAAPTGSTFSFAVVGDYGGGSTQETSVANNIASGGTQFVQTVGDNLYPDAEDPNFATSYSDYDARLYKPYGTVMAQQTVWFANGNHEYYGDGAFWQHTWSPNNERWYSYDWGDAHILVLDVMQPYAPGTAQYKFAQADLAANQSRLWRIVIAHEPPYSSSSEGASADDVRAYLTPLFEQQNVQLVLSGSSHNYERTYPLVSGVPQNTGGVTYIVSGGGGNGLNQFLISPPAWSAFRQAVYQHLRITVSPTALQVEAIADSGVLIDSFIINANIPVPPTNTITASDTPTLTPPPTDTPTALPTNTPGPTNTLTATVGPTDTPTSVATGTSTSTSAPHLPVFSDGFETGNFSAWTSSAGLIAQTTLIHSGLYAAQANTTAGNTYAKKTLSAAYPEGYARIYFNLISNSSQVNLLRFRTPGDGSLAYLFVNPSGKLGLRNDVAAITVTSTTTVPSGWHALEFHVVPNGSSSTTEVWLDGVRVNDLSITTDLGTNPIGRVQIGEVMAGRTYNVIFDDVVFDTQPIGVN